MDSFGGGFVVSLPFCAVCGPNVDKCVKGNPKCQMPKTVVNGKAHEKAARAYFLASRKKRTIEIMYVYNYYHYV